VVNVWGERGVPRTKHPPPSHGCEGPVRLPDPGRQSRARHEEEDCRQAFDDLLLLAWLKATRLRDTVEHDEV